MAKLKHHKYDRLLKPLQEELEVVARWAEHSGARIVILFEGRDAAGKGGTIAAISEKLNPRQCRVAALPKPTAQEATQWYFQRYIAHLPAAGEIVLFDRSWYNRAGVEQEKRFAERLADPLKRWKLSPIDLAAREKYGEYTRARETMLEATHNHHAPWTLVDFNDQRGGRLSVIRDLLARLPERDVPPDPLALAPLAGKPGKEKFGVVKPLKGFED